MRYKYLAFSPFRAHLYFADPEEMFLHRYKSYYRSSCLQIVDNALQIYWQRFDKDILTYKQNWQSKQKLFTLSIRLAIMLPKLPLKNCYKRFICA